MLGKPTLVASAIFFVAALGSSAFAQPIGIGPGDIPGSPSFSLGADEVVTGTVPNIPVLIESDGPAIMAFGMIETDADELQIVSLNVGPSLQAFIDDGGQVPTCDLIIEGAGGSAIFSMIHPEFDPAIYGNEYLTITVMVSGDAGTQTDVTISSFEGDSTTTVSIVAAQTELMRGDVNIDGNCDVTDAVELLNAIFVPGSDADCEDAGDIDDNGALEITDAVLLLGALFADGAPIDDTCQVDSTADSLTPCETTACSP